MPGKKLLVADDSLTIQKVIRLALSNEGYEIQTVADGNDAINQILLFRPDVVLIDVSLPGKNAFEVKREVNSHEDLAEIRFVLISSAFEKVDEPQVEEVTFHGRLTKPFDPAHLRNVLTTVLAQVTAKRMEPTSFIRRPPPLPTEPSEIFGYHDDEELPPLPFDLPPPGARMDSDESQPSLPQSSLDLSDLPPLLPENDDILPPPLNPEEISFSENDLLPPLPGHEETIMPPPPMNEFTGETDIQRLTESTMRISGMDDYQWSMNEPSMRPPPLMRDKGGSSFSLETENKNSDSLEILPPPPPPMFDGPPSIEMQPSLPPSLESDEEAVPSYYPEMETNSHSPILASEEKIDAMIHNQIEATLAKMIEKILPQIAEKLIKDEIHRLLSE